ncbi:serine/threonine protein kinase [Streptomyces sp. NBC_00190]|uniref:WD40 repeat domain-containing serine/threonine protein kinase n=1 Tax=unclassified Streptomyces TaxID=2593676 RepID=UPI002E285F7C|nr:serine/threonine-protein kinase [Streptomyces sp. NBC_00190]WSZ41766.1 serine/threonine protein kinase [Streptomyces sp. NBC_00868]
MRTGEHFSGRYRLDARLGHGGIGEVWRAYDVELGRPVAVKVLLEFDATDELLRRFRREAAIGARLQHPGITVVHDIGQHENRLFIVMELLEGEDLAHRLSRSPGGLPVAEAVGLALQAAEALAAAHVQKVVHRDLKPANLFLLADGRLKICDFGIARTADATDGLTVTGRPFGTPSYMAPEQWRGEHVDSRCDLYALGCVLHALLTGAPPFPVTAQPWALMRRHLDETPADLRTVRADASAELAELVASLLAKDPAGRPDAPTTAERLRAVLNPAPAAHNLHTAPTKPALPSPSREPAPPRTPAHGPRRRTVVLGGLAALAVGSAGVLTARHFADDTGGPGVVLADGTSRVESVAFSPDGKRLAGGYGDNTIRLWDIASRTTLTTLTGHTNSVVSVAFSPDGKTLASGSSDHTVRLWDVASRTGTATLTGHTGGVRSVVFSPDGMSLASAAWDNAVRVWDMASRTSTTTLTNPVNATHSVAFSPDGKTLASGSGDTTLQLWDLASHTSTAPLMGHTGGVRSVAFSPDGKRLASGSSDHTIRLWDAIERWSRYTFAGHTSDVDSVAFSPDGKTLASGSSDNTVRLWDVKSGNSTATLTGHTSGVASVAFSHDGKTLASGSSDSTIRLWKLS